jgi:hypothetical protein
MSGINKLKLTTMKITDLKQLHACKDGYEFAQSKSSLLEAWNTCERGD